MRLFSFAPGLAAALALAGCSGGSDQAEVPKSTAENVQILEARLVLPLVKDSPGAVYFNLVNEGDRPQKVLSVDVAGTDMAMMHETIDKGGHSAMQMVQNAVLPAHGELPFAPGGKHVMVTGIKPELQAGTSTVLKINFDSGDSAAIAMPVISPAAAAGK